MLCWQPIQRWPLESRHDTAVPGLYSPFPTNSVEEFMARKTIFVSDISGKEISSPNDAATVTIAYGDARKGTIRLDVLAAEVDDLARKGTGQARRGRPPKS